MTMTGSEIIINCLLEQGVDTVFGYPGGTILNVYDALYRYPQIKHILTAHEQGAAHAADGYARVTGKVGVCMATSGPGCANLVTGIATAFMDSVPMVAITCNVAKGLLGKDTFQEIDITGVTMPITKHNYIVSDIEKLADTIRDAFYIAASGRPGPVLIDITKDVTAASFEYQKKKPAEVKAPVEILEDELSEAVKLINKAKKPLIMCGGGVVLSGADAELKSLVKKLNCPVTCTLMGIGGYDTNSENYTGMVGMHGTKASNIAVNSCDLLIALGARFSDRVTSDISKFAKNAKILQIDIDKAEVRKNIRFANGLVGDIKNVVKKLLPLLEQKTDNSWKDEILAIKASFPHMDLSKDAPINAEYLVKEVHKYAGDDTAVITEVGQHQMWTAQFYPISYPRQFLTSGGLGTMGYGTGAAMGAAIGTGKRVVSFAGDGCFRMNCNELSTIRHYDIPVVIIVVNNGVLGMVRQWQSLFYSKRYSQTTLDRGPDFKKLAEAYFIDGYTVKTKAEFTAALKSAFSKNEPAVIDVHIDMDDCVFPMVGPGQPIMNIITKKD